MMTSPYNAIFYLGDWGPYILMWISVILLYKTPTYLFLFVLWTILNILLNYLLKGLIRQPRPNDREYLTMIEEKYRKILNFGRYGMPSGHTQVAVFSTLFVYLVTRKKWILAAYGIVALVVMFQRVEFGFHTTLQVLAGALVGCLVAVIAYLQGGTSVKGLLKQKQDDNYFGLNWSTQ